VLLRLLKGIEAGQGGAGDLEHLTSVCEAIAGKTLCPFGDAAIAAPLSALAKFRAEFDYHVREKRCWRGVAATFEEACR